MNYQQRWLLAVAMKQPYPTLETGAAESTTVTVTPPTFVVAEASEDEQKATQRKWLWTGLAIGAVGAVLIDRLLVHRMLKV